MSVANLFDRRDDEARVVVWLDGARVGAVIGRAAGQFEAVLADGGSLGWYTSKHSAAKAILENCRGAK